MMQKRYAKGFKLDREKIAKSFNLASRKDPSVDTLIRTIISKMNREGYKYIGTAYDHDAVPGASWTLCNVIVMAESTDKEALSVQDLGPLDNSIEEALPFVLDGPNVWELRQ